MAPPSSASSAPGVAAAVGPNPSAGAPTRPTFVPSGPPAAPSSAPPPSTQQLPAPPSVSAEQPKKVGLLERWGLVRPKDQPPEVVAPQAKTSDDGPTQVTKPVSDPADAKTAVVPKQPPASAPKGGPGFAAGAAAGATGAAGVAAAVQPKAPPVPAPVPGPAAFAPRPVGAPAVRPGSATSPPTLVGGQPVAAEQLTSPKPAAGPAVAPAPKPKAGTARRTRKARLRLSRLDPWSVMKTSFLFSIAAGIMLVVAVYVVWTVLASSGLFASVNEIVAAVVSTPGDTTPFRIEEYLNGQKVVGVAALVACIDVLIFTSLATLGSFLYNLAATMLGGLEITLAED